MPTWGEWAQLGTVAIALLVYLQSRKNGKDIAAVKHSTNSMKDELVAEVRSASHAAGVKDEKEAAVMRAAEPPRHA